MSTKTMKIIPKHIVNYTDSNGDAQERVFETRVNGKGKLYEGGSAFIAMVTLVLLIPSAAGEIVLVLSKLVARIRVDGELVLEPKVADVRGPSWFDTDGNERPGAMLYDLVGDESRIALAKLAEKQIPAFAKRVKSARAALLKRAEAA